MPEAGCIYLPHLGPLCSFKWNETETNEPSQTFLQTKPIRQRAYYRRERHSILQITESRLNLNDDGVRKRCAEKGSANCILPLPKHRTPSTFNQSRPVQFNFRHQQKEFHRSKAEHKWQSKRTLPFLCSLQHSKVRIIFEKPSNYLLKPVKSLVVVCLRPQVQHMHDLRKVMQVDHQSYSMRGSTERPRDHERPIETVCAGKEARERHRLGRRLDLLLLLHLPPVVRRLLGGGPGHLRAGVDVRGRGLRRLRHLRDRRQRLYVLRRPPEQASRYHHLVKTLRVPTAPAPRRSGEPKRRSSRVSSSPSRAFAVGETKAKRNPDLASSLCESTPGSATTVASIRRHPTPRESCLNGQTPATAIFFLFFFCL